MLLLPPGYQFKNLDSSKIMLFGLFLLETFERTAVTLNLCSHEHQGRVGPFFGSGFIFSVSSMPAWEAHSHTQNAVAMPGGVQDQLQELYCDCTAKGGVAPSHKWKSGHGLSKGPLTTLISDFIILCINLLLFILPPAGVPDKNEHKKKQEYSILFMPAKDEHVVLFCALKSASNSHRP